MGAMKTAYQWTAALALLHMIALAGGVAYLFGSGTVDAKRLREAVAMLRDADKEDDGADKATEQTGDAGAEAAPAARLSPEQQRLADEVAWRNSERYRTQIDQRLKLINLARLDVERRREALERLREKDRKEREERARQESVAGYAKEVEIIAALKPKAALSQILSMTDGDAAQTLFRLETRKVKRIIEAARTDAEKAKMTTVLRLIADLKSAPVAQGEKGSP